MVESLPVVGAILDAMVIVFLLLLHSKKDDRTWTQRLGVTFMLWFLVCHFTYQFTSGVFGPGLENADGRVGAFFGVFGWNLWRMAMLAFVLAMFTVPMPWFRHGKTYLWILGVLLALNLLEAWFIHGTPAQTGNGFNLWFAMSPEAIIMIAVYAYLGWSYLTSETSGEDDLEKTTDRAGLFAILAVTLWAGKNWFDWFGVFTLGEMFYYYYPAWSHPFPILTTLTWTFEYLVGSFALFVFFVGAVMHLNKRGSRVLGGFLVFVLFAGMIRYYLFSASVVDYDTFASILNEESVTESFVLLTHGTMQSLARPLIVLFISVRFGFVRTDHHPVLSRGMIIMVLAGSMSTVTEILQPILGISQLVSGFLLGAVLAFELERRVLAAMQPPEGEYDPEWLLESGDPRMLERWTNIGFASFLIVATAMIVLIAGLGV